MGKYKHDMTKESDPAVQLPAGWAEYIVSNCTEEVSKKGNDMFKVTLMLAVDNSITGDVYAIAEQGKRWFLKQLLHACEVPAAADGVYDWDIADVIDKHVMAQGVPKEEKWIDREGNDRVSTKVRIVGFRKIGEDSSVPF